MAEHDWPTSLPHLLVSGEQRGGGEDGVIRSTLGRASKLRPRWTAPPPEPVQMTVLCSQAQLQTLLDFYNITLRRVLPFNYRDHTKPDDATVEYRFTGRPSYQPSGSRFRWVVTLRLEQLTTYQGTFPVTDGDGSTIIIPPETLTT